MKTILVTGGAGFVGSNFIKYMLKEHPDYMVINVDTLTYAGNLGSLKDVEDNPNYRFFRADIRDRYMIEEVFSFFAIDYVVNFAAESREERLIIEPDAFLTTNIIGTQVLLDAAKTQWKLYTDDKYSTEYKEGVRFHQVSTDEVYGSISEDEKFAEDTPLSPNSPYSASKASADLIARAYHLTYGMPVTISRCSNNYGPYQFPEKLIPLMINNCLNDKPLPVYGDGLNVRDWLHVEDHCKAIDLILHLGKDGDIYNIGGNNERTNLEVVKLIVHTLEKSEDLISFVKDRPGHDRRYATDSTKIKTQLGWNPDYSFEQGMTECISWYQENWEWVNSVSSGDYKRYLQAMYG